MRSHLVAPVLFCHKALQNSSAGLALGPKKRKMARFANGPSQLLQPAKSSKLPLAESIPSHGAKLGLPAIPA